MCFLAVVLLLNRCVCFQHKASASAPQKKDAAEVSSHSDRGEKLAKLSSFDKQRDTHSRQLKKVFSCEEFCECFTELRLTDFLVRHGENEHVQTRGETERHVKVLASISKGLSLGFSLVGKFLVFSSKK